MNNVSVLAMKAAVIVCMILVIVLAVGAPWLIGLYAGIHNINMPAQTAIMICYYICVAPVMCALIAMLKMLGKIQIKRPFDVSNISCMKVISWCCLAVAAVCGVGAGWYMPLLFVCIPMIFLFLVVRVMCTCFITASKLQEENDLTV